VSRWAGLVRLAFGLTGDRQLAEDVAQITLAKAYVAWRRVSRVEDPNAAGNAFATTTRLPLHSYLQFQP
jgi:DNA-directed RNA polymerase specialized sigma24 family protein